LLGYKVEEKGGPKNNEDAQGEKQHGKNKKKDKGKVKSFGKTSEDKDKKRDTPKEKGNPIPCWICEKDHYVKNYPMKKKLSIVEQEEKPCVGVLQVLGVVLEEKSTRSQEKMLQLLFYVSIVLNGISMVVMVDSGVTHNFMKEDVVRELGLQLELAQTSFKAVNLRVEKVIGMTNEVTLKLGYWSGTTSFTIVPMDILRLFLGKRF
jgi:hypothetical protein